MSDDLCQCGLTSAAYNASGCPVSSCRHRDITLPSPGTAGGAEVVLKRVIPADERRYPPGCPDGDWCRGNRICYWNCRDDGHE
jgi:hypothetical protein